jgi:hypothetical protein
MEVKDKYDVCAIVIGIIIGCLLLVGGFDHLSHALDEGLAQADFSHIYPFDGDNR